MIFTLLGSILVVFSSGKGLSLRKKYIQVSQSKSWIDAKNYCEKNYKQLAIINNGNDNSVADGVCSGSCWFAANDINHEGKWENANGGALKYTNWNTGEPNDAGKKEDCAEIMNGGKWNDLDCSTARYFICETKQRGYFRGPNKVNYLEAYHYCRTQGSILASLTSDADDEEAKNACGGSDCFIGYTDMGKEGEWQWLDGTNKWYTKWNPNEPNNSGGEDCSHIYNTGKWNDIDCLSYKTYPLCNPKNSFTFTAKNIKIHKQLENNFKKYYGQDTNLNLNFEDIIIKYSFISLTLIAVGFICILLAVILCCGYYYNFSTKRKKLSYQSIAESSAV